MEVKHRQVTTVEWVGGNWRGMDEAVGGAERYNRNYHEDEHRKFKRNISK
jgi:hypothetical protein